MKRLIALRRQLPVLGRGALQLIPSTDRRAIAYLRSDRDTRVFCVANLSPASIATQLDLRQFAATHFPQELFGRSEFPPIGDGFYPLTVGAWGFYWCELQPLPEDDLRRAQFFSCFISYSVRDREFAERLHQDLLESGVRCWFAPRDAQSGQKLYGQIKKAIGFTRAGAVDLVRAQHEE